MSCESPKRHKTVKLIHNSQLLNVRTSMPYKTGDTLLVKSLNSVGWLPELHAPMRDTAYTYTVWVTSDSSALRRVEIRRAIVVN